MGQTQLSESNPLLEDWEKHSDIPNTYVNIRTNEQAQVSEVSLKRPQEMAIKKRISEPHNFIAKILYYHPNNNNSTCSDRFSVYFERLLPISQDMWIPVTSGLSILKGFRRLSSSYGPMRVTESMVKVNIRKEIKVWVNSEPTKLEIIEKCENEEQMLADIVKIILNFDPNIGNLLVNCCTFNGAITQILQIFTENKSFINLNHQIEKKEEKRNGEEIQKVKNNFRSTQETEDDSLKIFDENLKYPEEPDPLHEKFLHHVQLIKTPIFINTESDQLKKANTSKVSKDSSNLSYSQEYMQKSSNFQIYNSIKASSIGGNRPFKPIKHRVQVADSSYYPFENNKQKRDVSKLKNLLEKPKEFTYYPRRQSNLSRSEIESIQRCEFAVESNQGSTLTQEKSSEMSTSREIQFTDKLPNEKYPFANRTKTQEFYSSYIDQFGYSPHLKPNYPGMTNENVKQSTSSSFMSKGNETVNRLEYIGVTNPKENLIRENSSEKRQMKLKQTKTIKDEMGSLGIINESLKPLGNEKSERDLLIKKKVEEKNKKHEELKFAITKLLND